MELGCMILSHDTITQLTKSLILRATFHEEIIEIEVLDKATTVIYLWNVTKEKVWQATMDLNSKDIKTVYAFGKSKHEAYKIASSHLIGEHFLKLSVLNDY
ncbi:hypothetical protein [Oceanobacillus sp. CAU 1775]